MSDPNYAYRHSSPGMASSPPSNEAKRGVSNLIKMTTGRFATQVVLALSVLIISRVFGPTVYGQYSAYMAVLAMMSALAAFGFPLVEARFFAPVWRTGPVAEAAALGSTIWVTRIALGLLAAVGGSIWIALSPSLGTSLVLSLAFFALALFRFSSDSTVSLFLPLGHAGKFASFEFARALLALPIVLLTYPAFGFPGVFAGLALMYLALNSTSLLYVLRIIRLRIMLFEWRRLLAHLSYNASQFVGVFSGMVQTWFAVYALAVWTSPREAAFLGIAVQAHSFVKMPFVAAHQGLMPILGELEHQQLTQRIRTWGSIMLRLSAAATCTITVLWALLGNDLVRWILTDQFAPVYWCVLYILVGVALYTCGLVCNVWLYIRGLTWSGAMSLIAYAAVTIIGMVLALRGPSAGAAIRVSWAYIAGSVAFFLFAYFLLGLRGRMWLPLRRSLLLLLPAFLIIPISDWSASVAWRLVSSVGFLATYGALVLYFRLVEWHEVQSILTTLRESSST